MKGYKAFNKDLTCRDFQYEIGKTYEMEDKPIICKKGFHFCKTIGDTYKFYPRDNGIRICEVEALGDISTENNIKFCTNKIKIVKEVTDSNLRKGNVGVSNSGYCNSGSHNSGDCNSGEYNSGKSNSGYWNSGDWNSGHHNSGDQNSGNYNSGDQNSGDQNSGDYNSGNYNSGDQNSGNCNSGGYNSGDYNSGGYNSGDYNSGYCNSGDWNSGDYNSGDWNSSSNNSGCFCTEDSNIKMFDKNSNWTYEDWLASDAHTILSRCPHTEIIVKWIDEPNMSKEEKKDNPSYLTTGGYLKVTEENIDRQEWWDNLSEEDKNVVMSLPNFDADKFYLCTGIKVKGENSL